MSPNTPLFNTLFNHLSFEVQYIQKTFPKAVTLSPPYPCLLWLVSHPKDIQSMVNNEFVLRPTLLFVIYERSGNYDNNQIIVFGDDITLNSSL